LKEAVELAKRRRLSRLEEQGLIQAFEYTHELAWNTLKDFLENRGVRNLYGSKDATREAFRSGLIENGEALELAVIVDRKSIQSMMDDFFNLSHIGVAVIDFHCTVLVATCWQDIRTPFHRVHPETCQNCMESDIHLSNGVALARSCSTAAKTICGISPHPSPWTANGPSFSQALSDQGA
jgi:hypothetical protein